MQKYFTETTLKLLWQVSVCMCLHSRLESIVAAAAACVDTNQARAQISESQINKHWRGPAQLMVDRGLPLCLWLSACTALCSSPSQLLQRLKYHSHSNPEFNLKHKLETTYNIFLTQYWNYYMFSCFLVKHCFWKCALQINKIWNT